MSSYLVGAVLIEIGRAEAPGLDPCDVPPDQALLAAYANAKSEDCDLIFSSGVDLLIAGTQAWLHAEPATTPTLPGR